MRSKAAVESKERGARHRRQPDGTLLGSHTDERLRASLMLGREDVTLEYPEFQAHIGELIELLRQGDEARPGHPRGIFSRSSDLPMIFGFNRTSPEALLMGS